MIGWTRISSAGPAAREDHTWTVSGDGTTALLFGGRDGGTVFGDLWAFSFIDDSWIELPSEGGPAARFGHEAVWVDGIGLVVFAGQNGPDFFDDLWAYDPATETWRQLPWNGAVPVARYGTCAAVGPDGRLWISHGFTADGVRFSDTRAYDFASGAWTDETPASGARPVERCLHACWWTDDGAFALFGGQTTGVTALGDRWLLQDGSWSEVVGTAAPERNLYAAARVEDATAVFGGQALDGSYLDDFWWLRDDDADAFEVNRSVDGPSARAGAAMVMDSDTGRGLLFGGRDAEGAFADTWQFESLIGVSGG
ncbi:MAG: hypothetical protein QOI85_1931 [Chloroflexota bacterium]|jgi:hypothetical protein|nr:hypothetical protein [Chloroflexota bacterium]